MNCAPIVVSHCLTLLAVIAIICSSPNDSLKFCLEDKTK